MLSPTSKRNQHMHHKHHGPPNLQGPHLQSHVTESPPSTKQLLITIRPCTVHTRGHSSLITSSTMTPAAGRLLEIDATPHPDQVLHTPPA